MLDVVFGAYHPNQVVALKRADADSGIPLLKERTMIHGKAAAYVCGSTAMITSHFSGADGAKKPTPKFTCQMPVNDVDTLHAQLTR